MGEDHAQHRVNADRSHSRSDAGQARGLIGEVAGTGPPQIQRVLQLQRTAGNAAVARLLSGGSPGGPVLARSETATLAAQAAYALFFGGASAALSAWNASEQAIRWANEYFQANMPAGWGGHLDSDGGPRNALRHCLWSALTMTRALRHPFGPTPPPGAPDFDPRDHPAVTRRAVREALLGHEFLGSGGLDSAVDQRNNEIGMDIGQRLDDPAATDEEAYAAVRDACYAALEDGALKMLDEDKRVRSTAGWREVPDSHIWDRWTN